MGHVYGDKVLVHVGKLLKRAIVGNTNAYRLGGDEFLVMIPNVIEDKYVIQVIEEINEILSGDNEIDQIPNHITFSLGVTRYPADGKKVEEILMKSDIAMYSAKKLGRNQYQFFNQKMIAEFGERVSIEQHLRRALEMDAFLLHYQPIVDARSGETIYYEALLRLDDFAYPPNQFIPVAEETGMIVPIGKLVIRRVFELLSKMREMALPVKPIAINLSPKQINEASVVEYIRQMMIDYNIGPELIEIEITENVLLEFQEENIATLEKIKQLDIFKKFML